MIPPMSQSMVVLCCAVMCSVYLDLISLWLHAESCWARFGTRFRQFLSGCAAKLVFFTGRSPQNLVCWFVGLLVLFVCLFCLFVCFVFVFVCFVFVCLFVWLVVCLICLFVYLLVGWLVVWICLVCLFVCNCEPFVTPYEHAEGKILWTHLNARVEWIAWQVKISDLQPQSELLTCFF